MLQPIIYRSYLIELTMTTIAVGQRYKFNDIPQLRAPSIFVQGIEAFTAAELSQTPDGRVTIAAASAAGVTVTFVVRETEELFNIPYSTLVSATNAGIIRMFANKQINLSKSYITVLDAAGINANESVLFNFYYKYASQSNR